MRTNSKRDGGLNKDELAQRATDKYYLLFNSINQGFCIIEMIWDEKGNPVDYRFLEVNAAFERQTKIKNAKGRTMREIEPDHEAYWFQIYAEIAKTKKTVQFEHKAEALMGGWYEVYAFPITQ
jgi:PAS domain-containing protein